jgi:signal transduction histidine kinase
MGDGTDQSGGVDDQTRAGTPLRVLIVEHLDADALRLVAELQHGGFDVHFERVDNPGAFTAALARPWDVVLSDYSIPGFDAQTALTLAKERKLDLPFIIVSGTAGEDVAIDATHAGAHDFMVKGNLARLTPAIRRELRDAELRAERARMQDQLLISDRMASVGVLAAGVAHEINNPLAALMANLNFLSEELAAFTEQVRGTGEGDGWMVARLEEIRDPLRDARESAERVRHIVRDLKVFSRTDDSASGPVDLRRVIESSLRMAWNEIRHRARLVKDFAVVPAIDGNEGRVGQVFLNLIINAAQAIEEGKADQNELRVTTRVDRQGRVVAEVTDTGSGIPADVLPRIFDPFFTTKPIGVGTGLGLAICHRIITSLGGKLEVETRVGTGTTMRITLPAAKGTPAPPASSFTPVPSATRGRRRAQILVIDDEPLLGTALRRMFSAEHEVQFVSGAREALALLGRGARFDLIFCDLMMPEVTGMDLHAELSRLAPDQAERMVFMTGGAFTSRAREFLDQVRNPRFDKPFDVAAVRALVHGLLH